MAVKVGDLEAELIDAVCERIGDLPEEQRSLAEAFIRQYYHWVPAEDLAGRGPADLYGAAIAHWKLALERPDGEPEVRVYNPDPERDGWSSPNTVLEVVSDDMPFIVDSVTMALAREGYTINLVIHPVIRVRRDAEGQLADVVAAGTLAPDTIAESVLHVEVLRERAPERLKELHDQVRRVLDEVRLAVEDWQPMRDKALALVAELEHDPPPVDAKEIDEVKAFLEWAAADHFTFLGFREYDLVQEGERARMEALPETGLGILRRKRSRAPRELSAKATAMARTPHLLVLTTANSQATVHRPAYLDYIGVKRFDADGNVTGERRFLGLYTSAAYRASPRQIPLLRDKVEAVLGRAGFLPASHDAKALLAILESFPRDALFQFETGDLFEITMGVLGLGERQQVRVFVWEDPLERFVWCLVTIPRDRFNTENRERIGKILLESFRGNQLDWTLQLSESLVVRVHYVIRSSDGIAKHYDVPKIEAQLVEATRPWSEELRQELISEYGEEQGMSLFGRYQSAFQTGYRSDLSPRVAVQDIARIEKLEERGGAIIKLYRPERENDGIIRSRLYSSEAVSLSEVLPTFEHMGTDVMDERPFRISPADGQAAWIYDFGLRGSAEDVERVRDTFEEVFLAARRGVLEDDRFNGLVLAAALTGREIVVLRAVAKYLRQAGIPYSDAYMERTLIAHPKIAAKLVKLFVVRFDPDAADDRKAVRLVGEIDEAIDEVESLDEDRILRGFLSVMRAMLRTNYFRHDPDAPLPFLSLKLEPQEIPLLPKPRPKFEVFVYSPRFEAVHLRGGKVARGGIRWSNRPEDFRTEVLGLMKAQMVKNALIVPVGAKGGFVLKRAAGKDSDETREEAIACYQMFLRGLLDLTDNIVDGEVVTPPKVVRYDEDDTYLVVAADKGTATFSDIANGVSAEYDYWLGDAFASGGSHGYDHKQMAITARGAWESVTRHFRELGTNVQSTDFTVVGIGDMSGDVFGNGMLLSRHIKLIAAFDHRHVFLDPDPDPEASFAERQRLFDSERSSWDDYDRDVLSEGGGIYERTAKSITIGEQAKEALAIDADELSPVEVIKAILCAPVDLLLNGGIGTYVKASQEAHSDVGDKANDLLRANGRDLRCRVVGEGGNLGFTQLGRIEYAQKGGPEHEGGRINTDSIDNAGGVNCSDHEVNIKILLDSVVRAGDLSEEERNGLLVEMTEAVASQVLYASYTQTQAISLALAQAEPMIDVHARLIRRLEQVTGLDRELEFLPSEDTISERKADHQGLLAPELAIVMAYTKIHLYGRLLGSDLPEDEHLAHDLERYFPPPLGSGPAQHQASLNQARPKSSGSERYAGRMRDHRLRREIIATVVANQLVDRTGTTFAFRLGEETGASPPSLARAYAVAREVFEMRPFWEAIEALDNEIDADLQLQLLIEGRRLTERASRWLVLENPAGIRIDEEVERFKPGAELLAEAIPSVLDGTEREAFHARVSELMDAGVPQELASRVAAMPSLTPVFDVVAVAELTGRELEDVMHTYFRLASRLELSWLRDRIYDLPRANRWQALARAALRDDLLSTHRELTREVLERVSDGTNAGASIDEWVSDNAAAVERALNTLADIRASRTYDTTTLPVALREVRTLIRGSEGEPSGGRSVS